MSKESNKGFLDILEKIPIVRTFLSRMKSKSRIINDVTTKSTRDVYVKAYQDLRAKMGDSSKDGKGAEEEGFSARKYKSLFEKMEKVITGAISNKLRDVNIILTLGMYSENKRDIFIDSNLNYKFQKQVEENVLMNNYVHWSVVQNAVNFDIDKSIAFVNEEDGFLKSGFKTIIDSIKKIQANKSISAVVVRVPLSLFIKEVMKGEQERLEGIKFLSGEYNKVLNYTLKSFDFKTSIYVLFTEIESIYGFNMFISSLSGEEKRQFFGWSNPFELFEYYTEKVSENFFDVFSQKFNQFISEKMLESIEPEVMKSIFLFKNGLFHVLPQVKLFLDSVFLNSYVGQNSLLRGVYFSGYENNEWPKNPIGAERYLGMLRVENPISQLQISSENNAENNVNAKNEVEEKTPTGENLGPDVDIEGTESKLPNRQTSEEEMKAGLERKLIKAKTDHLRKIGSLLFFRELYEKKIAREFSLNIPSIELMNNNQFHRVTSVSLLSIAILSFPLVYYVFYDKTMNSFDYVIKSVTKLTPSVNNLSKEKKKFVGLRKVNFTDLFDLYEIMEKRRGYRLSTPFSPLTYFSSLDTQVDDAFNRTLMIFAVEPIYNMLLDKIDRLNKTEVNLSTKYSVEDSYVKFSEYIKELNKFEKNLGEYNLFTEEININKLNLVLQYLVELDLSNYFNKYSFVVNNVKKQYKIPRIDKAALISSFTDKYEVLFNNLLISIENDQIIKDYSKKIITYVDDPKGNILNNNLYEFLEDLKTSLEYITKKIDIYTASSQIMTAQGKEIKIEKDKIVTKTNTLIDNKVLSDMDVRIKDAISKRNDNILDYTSTYLGDLYFKKDEKSPIKVAENFNTLRSNLIKLEDNDFYSESKDQLGAKSIYLIQDGFDWNKVSVDQIGKEIDVFQKFVTQNLKGFPDNIQPIVRDVAFSGINQVIIRQMNLNTNETRKSGFSDVEKEAYSMNRRKDDIVKIVNFFSDSERRDVYNALVGLTQEKALFYMDYFKKILENTVHYRPKNSVFDWWDGSNPPAFEAYNVYGQRELVDYISQQNSALASILNDYVQPLLDMLGKIKTDQNYKSNSTYLFWSQLSTEFNSKEKTSSLDALSTFIQTTLTVLTSQNCFSLLEKNTNEKYRNDYFSQINRDIVMTVKNQCKFIFENKIAFDYNNVVKLFNEKVAGKFPFVSDLDIDHSDEIDEGKLRDFLIQFNSFVKSNNILENISVFRSNNWQIAYEFIKRLENVYKFLWPLIGDDKTPPKNTFEALIDFNQQKENESNTFGLLERKLEISGRKTSNLITDKKFTWNPLEPVSFNFHWAKDYDQVPNQFGRTRNEKYRIVDNGNKSISFIATDKWSLFYMIKKHALGKDEFFYTPELAFKVPIKKTIPMDIGDEVIDSSIATIIVKLKFFDREKNDYLFLPVFPTTGNFLKVSSLYKNLTRNDQTNQGNELNHGSEAGQGKKE